MRILVITANYIDGVNGVAISIRQQIEELKRRGHKVTLAAPGHPNEHPGKNVVTVPSMPIWLYPDFPIVFPMAMHLRMFADVQRAEVICFHNPLLGSRTALKLARLFNIPAVLFYHTPYDKCAKVYSPRRWMGDVAAGIIRGRVAEVMRKSDAVVVETGGVLKELEDLGMDRKIRVIPTGRKFPSRRKVSKTELRNRYKIDQDKVVILTVSRLSKEKNLAALIDVFDRLGEKSGAMLVVVGDGPDRVRLEGQVKSKNLKNVRFVGKVSFFKVADFYQLADIFAYSSIIDTQAIVLIEAMNFGLPLVCFRAPGPVEFITVGENGYIADNNEEFLKYLMRLVGNSIVRKKMGAKSHQESLKFSFKKTIDKTEKLLGEVIEKYRSTSRFPTI